MTPNQITAANAGWRLQFRFAVHRLVTGVAEFTSEVIRQGFFRNFSPGF